MQSSSAIDLSRLVEGFPAITPAFGAALSEACAICLSDRGHLSGVSIEVRGDFFDAFTLQYPEVTEQMRRCWNDKEYTTEQAAYGIAILIMQRLTMLTVIERSRRGTGFDYWLGKPLDSTENPFEKLARLEVSGIRQGSQRQVLTRVKLKVAQVEPTNDLAPAYIVVIEFSQPLAWAVKR